MSKHQKQLQRLFNKPTDFRWAELKNLLIGYGYELIEGDGSRVKFINRATNHFLDMHKPHPGNIVKAYMVKKIIKKLKEAGITP